MAHCNLINDPLCMASVQFSHVPLPYPHSATLTLVPGVFRIPPVLRVDVTTIQRVLSF